MKDRPVISPEMANRALRFWDLILTASADKMPMPFVGIGPDDEIFYSWNTDRYHLELEIIPGGLAEFFFRDRETEDFWGEDCKDDMTIPPRIVETFRLFPKERS